MKGLYAIEDLCSGCRLCEIICSFVNTGEFSSRKAKIRIAKVEVEGVSMPILDCGGTDCPHALKTGVPMCVKVCAPGALIFATIDEVAKMRRELVTKRMVQPLFRVIAPWKWPFPWRKWPFEEMKEVE